MTSLPSLPSVKSNPVPPRSGIGPHASVQLGFDLNLKNSPPLVPLEAVQWLLQRDEDSVLELIENGLLRWAFNISGPHATSRRELRVWNNSLQDYIAGHARMGNFNPHHLVAPTFDDVIRNCLPPGDAIALPASQLARRWTCSRTHINQLCAAGALVGPHDPDCPKYGPHSSRSILRASAADFLRRNCESINNNQRGNQS